MSELRIVQAIATEESFLKAMLIQDAFQNKEEAELERGDKKTRKQTA